MRKIFFLILISLVPFSSCFSQSRKGVRKPKVMRKSTSAKTTQPTIKRTYLGLTLGKSTRSDAINYAKQNSYRWKDNTNLSSIGLMHIDVKGVQFANKIWTVTFFYNKTNLIDGIRFRRTYSQDSEYGIEDFKSYRNQLLSKYKSLCVQDTYKEDDTKLADLINRVSFEQGDLSISLTFWKNEALDDRDGLSILYNIKLPEPKDTVSDDL